MITPRVGHIGYAEGEPSEVITELSDISFFFTTTSHASPNTQNLELSAMHMTNTKMKSELSKLAEVSAFRSFVSSTHQF